MAKIYYKIKIREPETTGLTGKSFKYYESLVSSVHFRLTNAENLNFEIEDLDIVVEFDYIFEYYSKLNLSLNEISKLTIDFMKNDLMEMGVKINGK